MSHARATPDLSVVLAVGNAEDTIGAEVHALARHLTAAQIDFEILATNAGCRDNSFAVLSLLGRDLPTLRTFPAGRPERAIVRAAAEARALRLLIVPDVRSREHKLPSVAALGWAMSRMEHGRDAVVVRGRFILAHRMRCLPTIVRSRGTGKILEQTFEQPGRSLAVDVVGTRGPTAHWLSAPFRPLLRFLEV